MNYLLTGSVGGGVTVIYVESGGMTYAEAQRLADEINEMYRSNPRQAAESGMPT